MTQWRYGISFAEETPMTAPLPLDGDFFHAIATAAKYGYKGLELHTLESPNIDIDKYRKYKDDHGVSICAVASGRLFTKKKLSLLADDEVVVNQAISGMKKYIDLSSNLNTDLIIGWVKGLIRDGADKTRSLQILAERLKDLDDYAGLRNVKIYLEAINHYEVNNLNTADQVLNFITTNKLTNHYVHLDTYHMGIEETDTCKAIHMCGNKLGYFHVSDNTRRYPGSGQFDFKNIFKALLEIQYDGWITVECTPEPDREITAYKAFTYLKACEEVIR